MTSAASAPTSRRKKLNRQAVWGLVLALGPIIGFVLFSLIPMLLAVFIAFMDIKGYTLTGAEFTGFQNFSFVLTDPTFYKSIVNTLYSALSMPVSIVIALLVALMLTKQIAGKKFFRTVFFIPYVCSAVALTVMWKWMFDEQYGILNDIIMRLGGDRVPWITDAATFMPSMILMGVWSGTGFGIILFSAALTNVNRSYYEAAEIDGANAWQQFRNVTLPAISPTTFYLLIMGIIGALQDFTRFQVMTGDSGGPDQAGLTVVFYLYRMGFNQVITYGMGYASAVAWLLALLIVLVTILNFRLSAKWVHYD